MWNIVVEGAWRGMKSYLLRLGVFLLAENPASSNSVALSSNSGIRYGTVLERIRKFHCPCVCTSSIILLQKNLFYVNLIN